MTPTQNVSSGISREASIREVTTEEIESHFGLPHWPALGVIQALRLVRSTRATRTPKGGIWRSTHPMTETTGVGLGKGGGPSPSTPSSPGAQPSRPSTRETS